jgi:hypothetical protein
MSLHLQKFVDRVRGIEARGGRDLVMSITEAKDLHADITCLLINLQQLRETIATNQVEETITIKMDGGSF